MDVTSGSAPITAVITMSNDFFENVRYASASRAARTEAVGATLTWIWAATCEVPRAIWSMRSPTFSVALTGPGTYRHDGAAHHGPATGTSIVR
jgi:hypothetical protein